MSLRRRAAVVLACSLAVTACAIGEDRYETTIAPLQKRSDSVSCAGAFTAPDLAKAKPCGDGKGHCYDGARTPITDLPACEGAEVCVPDKILAANGTKLKSCTFFIGDAPGACLSVMVKDVGAHADQLQRDVCDDDERCVPCVDPTNGKETHVCDPIGAYEQACTRGSATRAPTCCHGAGVCLNREGIPEDSREDLSRDTCPVNTLCAPAALASGEPVKCTLLGLSGVCLDVCFAKMLSPTTPVTRSGCGPTETCLPCAIGSGQDMPGCD